MSPPDATSQNASMRLRGRRHLVALVLTAVAGFVDVFIYLALYHVFVANMSGNSIDLGLGLAQRDWTQVIHRGLPIVAFVTGLVTCGLIVEMARRHGVRHALSLTLTLEAMCLAAILVLGIRVLGAGAQPTTQPGLPAAALVALAAFAMGTQNASLRAAGVLNVYTTHVTGTLTRMSHRLVQFVFWIGNRPGGINSARRQPVLEHPVLRQSARLASLWLAYVGGATLGALSWTNVGMLALLAPMSAVALAAGLSLIWPVPPL